MSIDEIKTQLDDRKDELSTIEIECNRDDAKAERDIDNDYDIKISELSKELKADQKVLDEGLEQFLNFKAVVKEKKKTTKKKTKQLIKLRKEKKKALKKRLKILKAGRKSKIEMILKEIKELQKMMIKVEKELIT